MRSAVAVTYELDDAGLAASELAREIKREINLGDNSVGILFCDSDMDHESLLLALRSELEIDIIGCTAIGMLDKEEGFREFCVTLTVLTGDDIHFSTAVSEVMTNENAEAEIEAVYRKASSSLTEEPKLIYALSRGKPWIMTDIYPEVLTRVSGGIPVFGGVPSAGGKDIRAIFAEGGWHEERMAILLISGNIKPVFSSRGILLDTAAQKRRITKAKDNIIYEVGEDTPLNFLKSFGFEMKFSSEEERIHTFLSRPLFIEDPEKEISYVRGLAGLNEENGAVTANGKVEEGSLLSVGVLRKQDIEESASECIKEMLEKIFENEKDGYRYNIILCTSCIGRFLLLSTDRATEGNLVAATLRKRIGFSGFYGWGEFCPLEGSNQRLINKSHDETISMCAI